MEGHGQLRHGSNEQDGSIEPKGAVVAIDHLGKALNIVAVKKALYKG